MINKIPRLALPTWSRAQALLSSGEYELVKVKDLDEFKRRPPIKGGFLRRLRYLVWGV